MGPFLKSNTESNLLEIADFIKQKEGKIVLLKVLRNQESKPEILRLKLIPQKWSGHGLIGCKLNYIF
jgi:hypothetical protein